MVLRRDHRHHAATSTARRLRVVGTGRGERGRKSADGRPRLHGSASSPIRAGMTRKLRTPGSAARRVRRGRERGRLRRRASLASGYTGALLERQRALLGSSADPLGPAGVDVRRQAVHAQPRIVGLDDPRRRWSATKSNFAIGAPWQGPYPGTGLQGRLRRRLSSSPLETLSRRERARPLRRQRRGGRGRRTVTGAAT